MKEGAFTFLYIQDISAYRYEFIYKYLDPDMLLYKEKISWSMKENFRETSRHLSIIHVEKSK